MAQVTLTNDDFQDGETITDTKIDANFDDLKNAHNNHDAGTSSWQNVKVSNTNTNPVDVATSASSTEVSINNTNGTDGDPKLTLKKSGTTKAVLMVDDSDSDSIKITDGTNTLLTLTSSGITLGANLIAGGFGLSGFTNFAHRRPNLVYVSATQVDVENNTGTANETKIVFPDNTIRSVTEDTSSTHKYRRFDITADAEFTSGTEDSGLRAALSEANNTWYAIYAVKSAINSANFVLVGDTTLPLQANFATLNSAYGTNGWVYLGLIRNGDNDVAIGNILSFEQASDGVTIFKNSTTGNTSHNLQGISLATTASAASLAYTYAAGTGTAQIPSHIDRMHYQVARATGATNMNIRDIGASRRLFQLTLSSGPFVGSIMAGRGEGIDASWTSSVAADITLYAYHDGLLSSGMAPVI